MAKATLVVQKSIVLDITVPEASYLRDLLQNYLGPTPESSESYNTREALFTSLTRALKEAV